MWHSLLAGLVLLFATLPVSVFAIFEPGSSPSNPIYVQDVTPPQLQMPTQPGMTYEEYLRRLRPAANQPQQTQPSTYTAPQNDPYNCKAQHGPYSYTPSGRVGCSCLPGYQFGAGFLCTPTPVSKPTPTPTLPSSPVNQPSVITSGQCAVGSVYVSAKGGCMTNDAYCVWNGYGANSHWDGITNGAQQIPSCACDAGFSYKPPAWRAGTHDLIPGACVATQSKTIEAQQTKKTTSINTVSPVTASTTPEVQISWWIRFVKWLGL